jgi:hypothetical protein
MSFRGNLLSAAHAVTVVNSIVAAVLLSALISQAAGMSALAFLPFGLVILVLGYFLQGRLAVTLARLDDRPAYRRVRFPAPPLGRSSKPSGE